MTSTTTTGEKKSTPEVLCGVRNAAMASMIRRQLLASSTSPSSSTATTATTTTQTQANQTKLQPTVIDWDNIDKTRFYIFAPTASVLTRVVLYPTQLIKTRLQVQKKHSFYNGPVDAFRKIVRFEGVRALYKGFMPNLVNVAAGQVYITTYEGLKDRLMPHVPNEVVRNFMGGFSASLMSQVIMVPTNVVAQRMMVHGQSIDASQTRSSITVRQLVRETVQKEGVKGFYKGYWASIAAFAPSSALWWATYGIFRRWQSGQENVRQDWHTVGRQALAGSLAGVFTAVVTNPLDVIRARIQVEGRVGDGRSWLSMFKELWQEEQLAGMMKGVTARMGYMAVNSIMMITAYETVKRLSLRSDFVQYDDVAVEDIAAEACSN